MDESSLSEENFNLIRELVHKACGISLSDEKFSLVYSRLVRRLRALQLKNFDKYCELIKTDSAEFNTMINVITTNVTSFFRESHHFEFLKKIVEDKLIKLAPNETFKIWSAGCSTGEEPYTIAIVLSQLIASGKLTKASIIATDLSTDVLDAAREGVYESMKAESIPDEVLRKWFKKGTGANEGLMRVDPKLRDMIDFKRVNLIEQWPFKDAFHVIFCRNVIIYFKDELKKQLLTRYHQQLGQEGYLFLGHSENIFGVKDKFTPIGKTIFKKI